MSRPRFEPGTYGTHYQVSSHSSLLLPHHRIRKLPRSEMQSESLELISTTCSVQHYKYDVSYHRAVGTAVMYFSVSFKHDIPQCIQLSWSNERANCCPMSRSFYRIIYMFTCRNSRDTGTHFAVKNVHTETHQLLIYLYASSMHSAAIRLITNANLRKHLYFQVDLNARETLTHWPLCDTSTVM
jgi:hypothetical protein